jgi:hypothetical protein
MSVPSYFAFRPRPEPAARAVRLEEGTYNLLRRADGKAALAEIRAGLPEPVAGWTAAIAALRSEGLLEGE